MIQTCVLNNKLHNDVTLPTLTIGGSSVPFCGSVRCWVVNCSNGGFAVQRKNNSSGKLQSGNADYVLRKDNTPAQKLDMQNIVQLIGEMFDLIAGGENIYMTIGANRERTQFLLTIIDNGDRKYAAGDHLADLAKAVTSDLL
jgi:hypothetical protein